MHILLNRAHPKDATGVQNVRNNILLVTEADSEKENAFTQQMPHNVSSSNHTGSVVR